MAQGETALAIAVEFVAEREVAWRKADSQSQRWPRAEHTAEKQQQQLHVQVELCQPWSYPAGILITQAFSSPEVALEPLAAQQLACSS